MPGKICFELHLLIQQKLHRPLHVVRRHGLKIHEKTSVSSCSSHYAIVVATTPSKCEATLCAFVPRPSFSVRSWSFGPCLALDSWSRMMRTRDQNEKRTKHKRQSPEDS